MITIDEAKPDPAKVLTKALVKAADQMNFSQAEIAKIVGVSPATVGLMSNGACTLDTNSPEWDRAAALVLAYRSLASMLPNNIQEMRTWLHTLNHDFGEVPAKLMLKPHGLHQVSCYLDACLDRA